MGHTITVRLDRGLAGWLEAESKRTGVPQGKIIRNQLERAKAGTLEPVIHAIGRDSSWRPRPLRPEGLLARMKGVAETASNVDRARRRGPTDVL